ncbi:c-type cytochrome [Hyphomicrobium sp.]|uniref:c-type cytochrome n=1 Tax=Hyphomicrobium sp. TaxID=82 RepID=UPI0025BFF90B|nr:c-type cytochrome [Hyphomicrobium sp.]MCC7253495.1 c-type cytochrome [Hyphomicrobium sp.]
MHKTVQMRPALLILASVALAGLMALAGIADDVAAMSAGEQKSAAPQASPNPFAGDRAAITEGADLFGRNCQQCHSTGGIGGKCPQLIYGAWGPGGANSDELMFRIISEGRANTQMGAFKDALSQDEIWKIITYLRYEAQRYEQRKKAEDEEDDSLRR